MTIRLRDYQTETTAKIYAAWNAGHKNVLAVLPTGGGKSLTTATVIKEMGLPTCLMVHRGELVAQLSEALAMVGITHRIIASDATVKLCIARHIKKFGRSFCHPQSPVGVASVQTIVKRGEALKQWLLTVRLVVPDEAHHYLAANQFGTAVAMMPNAMVLGVTATPSRCDRKSLAHSQTGIFDILVEGPTPRWLINEGYLSDYRFIAPPPSIHMDDEDISESTGEFKADAIRKKSHASKIVGDIVQTYLTHANGKQGITFVVDIETATAVAQAFNDAGVPAAAVSGKTPDSLRAALMDKFATGRLKQLVNVDLFDEGLDLPGVEVVSMGRPTMSLGKYRQQAGRMIRPVYAPGYDLSTREGRLAAIAAGPKPRGIIIDHVENWKLHKLPDSPKVWQLVTPDGNKKSRAADDAIPMTNCLNPECFEPYERIHKACPYCGSVKEPAGRSSPEMIDGDLFEFSPELMAQLRGEVIRVDGSPQIPRDASEVVKRSIEKRWRERQDAQQLLRAEIAQWAGNWKARGATDSESYRRFFFTYGTDVASAMVLGATEAEDLRMRLTCESVAA